MIEIQEEYMRRAEQIVRRIQRNGPQAVFLVNGVVRTARASSELTRGMLISNSRALIGVYDVRAEENWIAEDIAYCMKGK